MTNKDLTEIVLVVDRSGSMGSIRDDAQGGINAFIEDQKKVDAEANFTLCQFDTHYEFVNKSTPIQDVVPYQLVPRGGTALYDAIGRTINETGERLAALPEHERPGSVMFMIVTDGYENSSKEFIRADIKKMIEHQRDVYSWNFTFLGVEEGSVTDAIDLGIENSSQFSKGKSSQVFNNVSAKYASSRGAIAQGMSLNEAYAMNSFTQEDKESFK